MLAELLAATRRAGPGPARQALLPVRADSAFYGRSLRQSCDSGSSLGTSASSPAANSAGSHPAPNVTFHTLFPTIAPANHAGVTARRTGRSKGGDDDHQKCVSDE